MRGDQLARQWRVIRAIEASPTWLTVAESAKREETGVRTIFDFGLVTQDTGQFLCYRDLVPNLPFEAQETGASWDVGLKTCDSRLLSMAAGFPLFTERVERASRWAFIDTFKFRIPSPLTLTELMPLYFYKDIVCKALVEPLTQYSVIRRAFDLTRESRLYDLGYLQ